MELSYLDQFNIWSINGGHLLIKQGVTFAFITMAIIVLLASRMETKKTGRSALHEILLVCNWIFGSLLGFALIANSHILAGFSLLGLIYLVQFSRELSCNITAPILASIPSLFWTYNKSEKRARERKIRYSLYRLCLVSHKPIS